MELWLEYKLSGCKCLEQHAAGQAAGTVNVWAYYSPFLIQFHHVINNKYIKHIVTGRRMSMYGIMMTAQG
jgi:hypothetical protein